MGVCVLWMGYVLIRSHAPLRAFNLPSASDPTAIPFASSPPPPSSSNSIAFRRHGRTKKIKKSGRVQCGFTQLETGDR